MLLGVAICGAFTKIGKMIGAIGVTRLDETLHNAKGRRQMKKFFKATKRAVTIAVHVSVFNFTSSALAQEKINISSLDMNTQTSILTAAKEKTPVLGPYKIVFWSYGSSDNLKYAMVLTDGEKIFAGFKEMWSPPHVSDNLGDLILNDFATSPLGEEEKCNTYVREGVMTYFFTYENENGKENLRSSGEHFWPAVLGTCQEQIKARDSSRLKPSKIPGGAMGN